MTERIKRACAELGVSLTDETAGRMAVYAALLKEWNKKMNLTAIRDDEGIAVRHFADSLSLLTVIDPPKGASLIDVGTGAGFPSMPVQLARPDMRITMLDSQGKRLTFLTAVQHALKTDCDIVQARAEEAGRDPLRREQYDFAAARAVAELSVLCELCLPFVKPGGIFAAMKGPDAEAEADAAREAVKALSAEIADIAKLTLPDGSGRGVVLIRKISRLSPKYPRPFGKITKSPLA